MKTNSDADSMGQYLVLMTTLAATQPVFAHANHHGTEEASPVEADQETAPVTTTPVATTGSDDTSDEVEQSSHLTTETVAAPVAQPPTAQGQLLDGFSIGLGESLLGLILVGPFVLISLKRMRN